MKLKRASFKHIEAEIYAYHDTLNEINALRQDILLAGRQEDALAVSGGGYVSSAVERRATRLADSVLLREMERITKAIADTYHVLREEGRRVIWIKYGLALNWLPPANLIRFMQVNNRNDLSAKGMADALTVDESTFHRYRTGFVMGVAERLGWY